MRNHIDTFVEQYLGVSVSSGVFQARAVYRRNMDFIEYMTKDEVTVSERIDKFLTLIWNFQQDEVVGFKLKGFQFIYDKFIRKPDDYSPPFLEIAAVLETLIEEVGEQVLEELNASQREAYERAITLARRTNAKLELPLAA